MTSVYRVTALWTGFQGAPGYSKFSFNDLTSDTARNACGAALKAYFQTFAAYLATGMSVLVQPTVQEFDMATGALLGEATMTSPPTATAGATSGVQWAAGAGFWVGWKTTVFFNGHRIQGRTFHCPAVGVFDTDGTLTSSAVSNISAAAGTLVGLTSPELCIWSKLWSAPDSEGHRTQIGGALAPVTSYVVKDQATSLRSRRT